MTIPLPPLKFKNNGQLCPKTTNIAQTKTPVVEANFIPI